MNYIYDITLNFNKDLLNFYEWDSEDDVIFYLKIPVFKVEDKVLDDFINSTFIVDNSFLKKICNKTECYKKKNTKYSALFTTSDKCIAISFNDKGESILKSNLSVDEEEDILEFSNIIKYSIIDYKIKEKYPKKNVFVTREEKNTKNKILNSIKDIYNKKEYEKLRYIFYELYNEKINNDNLIYNKLINITKQNSNKLSILKSIIDNIKEKSYE